MISFKLFFNLIFILFYFQSISTSFAQKEEKLSFSIAYFSNEKKSLNILDVEGQKFSDERIVNGHTTQSFGFNTAEFWFKIVIPPHDSKMFLEIPFAVLDSVSLYTKDETGEWVMMTAGDQQPMSQRIIPFHVPVFPIEIQNGKVNVCYLRIKSEGSLTIPIRLLTYHEFIYDGFKVQMQFGLLFGAILVLILVNILLWSFYRLPNSLLLAFTLFSALYFILCLNGYWQSLFLGDNVALSNPSMQFGLLLWAFFLSLYSKKAAYTIFHAPFLHKLLDYFMLLACIQFVLIWFLPFKMMIQISIILGVLTSVVSFAAFLLARARGYSEVKFSLTGMYFYIVGIFMSSLKFFGILETTFFSEFGIEIGVFSQAVFFTIAQFKTNSTRETLSK